MSNPDPNINACSVRGCLNRFGKPAFEIDPPADAPDIIPTLRFCHPCFYGLFLRLLASCAKQREPETRLVLLDGQNG
jgi:hypothetical protein